MAVTWATAIEDPISEWRWLLRLEGQGIILRYSNADSVVNEFGRDYSYEGILDISARPSISVDPYTSIVAVANVGITILPRDQGQTDTQTPNRFQDFEITKNLNFHQLTGTLYRWPVGAAFSEIADRAVIKGRIANIDVSTTGPLTFDIVDQMSLYDVGLPKKQIVSDNFSAAGAEAFGKGYPILFNAFTFAEAGTIDNANKKALLAGHDIKSLTTKYSNGASVAAAGSSQTDSDGDSYYNVTFSGGTVDHQYHLTGTGHPDDAQGYYTGTADALITHPCDIIHALARLFADIPFDEIDDVAFRRARVWWPNWSMNLNIDADADTAFFSAIQDQLTRLMRAAVFFEGAKLTIKQLSLNNLADYVITAGNLLDTIGMQWGRLDDVVNDLTVRYDWGYVWKTKSFGWNANLRRNKGNYSNFERSENLYGKRRGVLEAKGLNGGQTAADAINGMAALHWKPRKVATVSVDRTSHNVSLYDTVSATEPLGPSSTGAGWSDQRTVVVGIEYGLTDNTFQLLEI